MKQPVGMKNLLNLIHFSTVEHKVRQQPYETRDELNRCSRSFAEVQKIFGFVRYASSDSMAAICLNHTTRLIRRDVYINNLKREATSYVSRVTSTSTVY